MEPAAPSEGLLTQLPEEIFSEFQMQRTGAEFRFSAPLGEESEIEVGLV